MVAAPIHRAKVGGKMHLLAKNSVDHVGARGKVTIDAVTTRNAGKAKHCAYASGGKRSLHAIGPNRVDLANGHVGNGKLTDVTEATHTVLDGSS